MYICEVWYVFSVNVHSLSSENMTFFVFLLCIYLYFVKNQCYFLNSFNVYFFIFERERERTRTSRRGAEREGDTESEAGSRLRVVSIEPDMGLELANSQIMT